MIVGLIKDSVQSTALKYMYAYDTMVYSYGDIMLKNKKQIIKTRANNPPPLVYSSGFGTKCVYLYFVVLTQLEYASGSDVLHLECKCDNMTFMS